ncbi:hypothetical protein [Streptomyces sp. NPDC059080]|uniref:hypothetical protein n=1 Tax=Streptomyces sp. NPDC059080 TaxID=3346718 RepID=UPI0036D11078
MPGANGFTCEERGDGAVLVHHHGRRAAALRSGRAARFLYEVTSGDAQLVRARWTGSHRRGTERTARDPPRNAR